MKITGWQEKLRMLAQRGRLFAQGLRGLWTREYSSRGLALLFLLALGTGALTKSLANDSLTIGFDDYKLAPAQTIVDLNTLEKELIKKGNSGAISEQTTQKGESCFEEEA